MLERDILEWKLPADVLSVLLKDRTTGKNILWGTDDYANRGKGFSATDEILPEQIADKERPLIRPRVDKNASEQRDRVVKRAEVFTPSWICNKQNNLVDAAWFGWKSPDSSPFNEECPQPAPPLPADPDSSALPWKTARGPIAFPSGKTWRQYVKAPRMEVSCGEAPYLASRYDTVDGRMIPVADRIGLLDRKLRVVTENVGTDDPRDWLYYATRSVQATYGFDWQGDNVLLARENILATVAEAYNLAFYGEDSSSLARFTEDAPAFARASLLELADVISWNIWQMDGIKFVVPMSCKPAMQTEFLLDGRQVKVFSECPGCTRRSPRHNGAYCKIMDWDTGRAVEYAALLAAGGTAKGGPA